MKRTISIFSYILLSVASAFGQVVVGGTVRDASGVPVVGAAVMVEGFASSGAVTDLDGKYSIEVPAEAGEKAVLTVSCLSYAAESSPVGGRSVIDFVLQDDSELLEEVVVVGYGAMRRSDLTGAVTSVDIDEDNASRASSLDNLLQGKAAGVSVVSSSAAPDASVSVRIRGVTSLNGSNEPLYVIDGVIMTPSESPQMFTQGNDNAGSDEEVNALMGINPQDIESMEILKDASATAIYGSAGANGVVLITTKGAKRDRPTVRASVGVDVSTRYRTIDMLSFDEYVSYLEAKGGSLYTIYDDPEGKTGLRVRPVDWQDYMMRTAIGQRYHLSVSGRPKSLNYSFSAGYNKRDGIIRNTGSQQYTMRMNVTRTFSKKLKVGTKTSFAYIDSEMTQGASTTRLNASSSLMRSMMISRPYARLNSLDEEDVDDDVRGTPMQWVTDFRNTREEYRMTPHVFVEWKILRWLEFKSSVGGDFRLSQRDKWKGPSVNSGAEGAIAASSDVTSYSWNWDNTLNFNKKIRRHRLQGTLGVTTSRSATSSNVTEGWNISQYRIQMGNINSAVNSRFSYDETAVSMNSYFARFLYNYGDRYLLTATCRVDGSSKFSRRNRYSVFPSFAAAWRISEEKWFAPEWISMFKLRAGWGQVGNSGVSAYQIYSTYDSSTYADHTPSNLAGYIVGIYPSNIANPDLKWETTRQWNAGLDFGFRDGRLTFSVDVYDKFTYDLLQKKKIPGSSGFKSIWVNDGSIRNRGLELTVDATPVSTGGFEWNISGNISFNRNTLTSLGLDAEGGNIFLAEGDEAACNYYLGSNIGNGDYFNAPANIFIEGQPVGLFYGYKTAGIVPEGSLGLPLSAGGDPVGPGGINYCDLNGNGYLDLGDRTLIGDPNPDFTYGFSTSFSWNGLSLAVSCNGSFGNDLVNANLMQETDVSRTSGNIRREVFMDAWTPANQDARYPAINMLTSDEVKYMSDRIVEDGSFLRLADVSLAYDIPLPENRAVRGINVGLSAKNLYIWTRYSGWDPEVNSYGSDMTRIGVDCGSYPTARTFSINLRFTF
ncbi:MAG: TonB-dependent receptor [Bacteroidales bacterium]|nr:TonB-dependent receptor [Bacteroidales bacterium]